MIDQAHELKHRMLHPVPSVRVFAVVSGKGGVGKSNIALNLGIALNLAGQRVLLIDGDLGMANLDILAGLTSRSTLLDYFEHQKSIEDILMTYQPGLDILPGGSGLLTLHEWEEEEISTFVCTLIESGRYDYILIDAGAGVDAKLLSFVSVAHEVLLVTVSEPTALVDAYSLIKILSMYQMKPRLHLIVNQVSGDKEAKEIFERLQHVIRTFLNIQLELLGYVVSDPKVKEAVRRQVPFTIAFPHAQPARNIMTIRDKLMTGCDVIPKSSIGDVVHRFMKIFGA